MKYLTLVEFGPDDMDKVLKRWDETTVLRETTPDKFPKVLLEGHEILGDLPKLTENFRTFMIHETDDPKQLEDMVAFWKSKVPEMKTFRFYFVPIIDFSSPYGKIREQRRTSQ